MMNRTKEPKSKRTVKEHTVTEIVRSKNECAELERYSYKLDDWETSPKTDYTYAKTITYRQRSPTKHVEPPNMTRRSLHGRFSSDIIQPQRLSFDHIEQSSDTGSASQSVLSRSRTAHSSKSRRSFRITELQTTDAPDSGNRSNNANLQEKLSHSVTRSGTRYHDSLTTILTNSESDNNLGAANNQKYDRENSRERTADYVAKQREYAGLSMGVKESEAYQRKTLNIENRHDRHKIQLYGLDESGIRGEFSDYEDDTISRQAYMGSSASSTDIYSRKSLFSSSSTLLANTTSQVGSAVYLCYRSVRYTVLTILSVLFLIIASPYYLYRWLFKKQENQVHLRSNRFESNVVDRYSSALSSSSSTSTQLTSSPPSTFTSNTIVSITESASTVQAESDRTDLDEVDTRVNESSAEKEEIQLVTTSNSSSSDESKSVRRMRASVQPKAPNTERVTRRRSHAMSTRSRRSTTSTDLIGASAGLVEDTETVQKQTSNATSLDTTNVASLKISTSNIQTANLHELQKQISSKETIEESSVVDGNADPSYSAKGMSLFSSITTGLYHFNVVMLQTLTYALRTSTVFLLGVTSVILSPVILLVSSFRRMFNRENKQTSVYSTAEVTFSSTSSISTSDHSNTYVPFVDSDSSGWLTAYLFDTWFGQHIYSAIAYVFVIDTWLLRRRKCGLCCLLPLCLLLPFLLAGAFYAQQDSGGRDRMWGFVFGGNTYKDSIGSGCPPYSTAPGSVPLASLSETEIRSLIAQQINIHQQQQHPDSSGQLLGLYQTLVAGQEGLQQEINQLRADLNAHTLAAGEKNVAQGKNNEDQGNQLILIIGRLAKIEVLLKDLEAGTGQLKAQGEHDRSTWEANLNALRVELTSLGAEGKAGINDQKTLLVLLDERLKQLETAQDTGPVKTSTEDATLTQAMLAQLSNQYATKPELDSLRSALDTRLVELNTRYDSTLKGELEKTGSPLQAKLDQVVSDLSGITARLDEYGARLTALRSDMDNVPLQVDEEKQKDSPVVMNIPVEIRDDISSLQAQLAKVTGDIAELSKNCCGKATDGIANIEEQLALIAADRKQLSDLRGQLDIMNQQLQKAATEGGLGGQNIYSGLSEQQINALIVKALGTYHADRTGKADFALESAGGSVVSTRCSETYPLKTAQVSVFGIPLWYTSSSPRSVIQPEVYPGQCWAMTGDSGFIVIQLSAYVQLTEFSLEHIPKELAPDGNISSAPKDFSVWGLEYVKDFPGKNLGNYTYQENGDPLQIFQVQVPGTFSLVELRVHSNWGHPAFTCLYRFRVHGILDHYITGPPRINKDDL